MTETKRIMIAAASSGSGKTVITCGILEVLKRRGYSPVSFKCGPDYIDPMFHRTVLGIESHNLDIYLAGADGVLTVVEDALYAAVNDSNGSADVEFSDKNSGSAKNDEKCVAVMEGVMGIYDGLSPDSLEVSCYEIAKITGTPVILVVNCAGIGRTVISVIKGILADDDDNLIKGIILNRMSAAYFERIRPVLESELAKIRDDVRIIGYIPKDDVMRLESRYLGLVLPGEMEDLRQKVCGVADVIEECCDIETVLDLARADKTVSSKTRSRSCSDATDARLVENLVKHRRLHKVFSGTFCHSRLSNPVRIAVARDEVFCFYYQENLRLLEQLGVSIEYFSPLHDRKLPDGVSGMLLGGGYPELHLKELTANISMRESVRNAIDSGMPSLAECGGFMYLHRAIEGPDKKEYEMVGVVDGICRYTGHLVDFGYARITGSAEAGETGARDFLGQLAGMRGHEFHYYDTSCEEKDLILEKASTGKRYSGMIASDNSLWGFLHLYYPSKPEAVMAFIERMREYAG